MTKIYIFSRWFGYNAGGAERSVLEILKKKEKEGYHIHVLKVPYKGKIPQEQNFPDTWTIEEFNLNCLDLKWFKYFKYLFNRKKIISFFSKLESEKNILYSYGSYAPAAIKGFNGKTVYLIRSEDGVGWDINYNTGLKKITKGIQSLLDLPAKVIWKKDFIQTLKKSKVIANSKFFASKVEEISGEKAEVLYPEVDTDGLKQDYLKAEEIPESEKGIVTIGNSRIKGTDIVIKLAEKMPDIKFYIFAKNNNHNIKKNIIYMPWAKSSAEAYTYAKLVIVPSRWYESYPRVVLEPSLLNIPVVASTRGGIPEIIKKKENLVDELENIDLWKSKIEYILSK